MPAVTSVSPSPGAAGSVVTVAGDDLAGATSVTFAGTPATIDTDTPSALTVVVPAGASDGTVTVVTPLGTATSPAIFHLSPQIASFAPGTAPRGATVTVTGSGLAAARKVTVGGKRATVVSDTATQIVLTVPAVRSPG